MNDAVGSRPNLRRPLSKFGGGTSARLASDVSVPLGRGAIALALALLLTAAIAPLVRASHDAPTNVQAYFYSFGHSVAWTAPADGAQDGYKVQWKAATESWCDPTDSTCGTKEKAAAATATNVFLALAEAGLVEGATYTFRVGATKGTEAVAWSAEATKKVPWDCNQYQDSAITLAIMPNGTNSDYTLLAKDCTYLLNEIMPTLDPGGVLNWSDDLAISSWHGVTLFRRPRIAGNDSNSPVRVVHLNLPWGVCAARTCQTGETRTKLMGVIPPEFGGMTGADGDSAALSQLEAIDLRSNELTGAIPSELGGDDTGQDRLDNLNWLLLDNNRLSGAIPGELAHLDLLSLVWLSNNQLTGEIPAKLGDSKDWYIAWHFDGNQLTGAIPAGRDANDNPTGLAKLSDNDPDTWIGLKFDNNDLSGEIPIELARLKNLWLLDLGNNPNLKANLSQDIDITENGQTVTTSLGKELGKQKRLSILDLHAIDLSGQIPVELAGLGFEAHPADDIEVFLNCNKLTGAAPVKLADIKSTWTVQGQGATLTKLGLNGNPGLTIPAELQTKAATQLAAGQVTCPSPLTSGPPSGPSPVPGRPRARLTASLSAAPDPVSVGGAVTYTLTVTNTGGVPLSGLFWRSPELGVARRALGDGALAADAEATATFSFGPVTDRHLPGPIVVTVFADSDQTSAAQAALAVAVRPAAPTPPPGGTDATPATGTTAATASPAATATADPQPAVSALDLAIIRVFYSMPDPPDPNLGHNILALQLTLADGTAVACDFLAHYLRTGGLARWGYATSEILEERPNTLTQYYQRGAVDCHFRDGRWRVERRLTWDFIGGGIGGAPDLGVELPRSEQPGVFPSPWGLRVSNFAVDGTYTGFLDFFYRYGGVPAFGYPKTEARYDDDPAAVLRLPGAPPGVIRQYFQAAVFEHHPDDPASPVKLGLAGDVLRDLLYPNQTHQRFASFRPAPILTSGEGYVVERVVWNPPPT